MTKIFIKDCYVELTDEWTILIGYLGGPFSAADKLKETGTTHWESPNDATNESGFSALPGRHRNDQGYFAWGSIGFWWDSIAISTDYASGFLISSIAAEEIGQHTYYKKYGFSVRCLRD